MSILKSFFSKKDKPVKNYDDFWNWFATNERTFFNAVNLQNDIEEDFFNKLSPKLKELREGYSFLAGMYAADTAELVITADGAIENIVFVEELVEAAPKLKGWKFTALKPALNIKDVNIRMADYNFGESNMNFYANEVAGYPDEIDITIVHDDFNEENKKAIISGCYVFLDNFLGELEFVTLIDKVSFLSKAEALQELIPISKLKDYLNWRQKEFNERYDGTWHRKENDEHSILETELDNGIPLIAVINTDLLKWDSKPSHPWIMTVVIKFDARKSNGMPDKASQSLLYEIEDKLNTQLKDIDGYLNVGRETGNSTKEIHFACRDFRVPSKVAQQICNEDKGKIEMSYEIYKDKYWKTFNRFTGI